MERFCIATDHLDYFEKIKEIARANLDFAIVDPASVDLPLTKFERYISSSKALRFTGSSCEKFRR